RAATCTTPARPSSRSARARRGGPATVQEMAETSPYVVDVGGAELDAAVLERSHETPVLVDFWAPWCGPCRALGPVLEQLANEFGGTFVLAKVDTEAHPELGSRFQVRSIPAVKLFHRGQPIAEFVGALPGSAVRRFLETHLPSEADALLRDAEERLAQGDRTGAREVLREALEADPQHAGAHLRLARLAWAAGEAEIVRHHVAQIGAARDEYETAQHLLDALRFLEGCADAGGEAACRAKLE